jgi:predicted ArsR family transcriptional regulator
MSNMAGVLALVRLRVHDRADMARRLGISKGQVTAALRNLQYRGDIEVLHHRSAGPKAGRQDSIYRPKGEDWGDFRAAPLVVGPLLKGVRSIFEVK